MKLQPVILAGGSGTRLWPMSRESFPKQFLALLEGRSPFQATLDRCASLGRIEPPIVVVNHEHRFLAADQALVAQDLVAEDPRALILVLPADHDIPDEAQFADAVETAQAAAEQGNLMVF